ncbi:YTH domain-containing family protein 2 [Glycine max]|nr:YTH domain-containing family protein 2 [Glycine max]
MVKVFIKDCISSDLTSFVTSSGDVAAGFTEKDSMADSICSSNHSNSASSAFLAQGSVIAKNNPKSPGLMKPNKLKSTPRNGILTSTISETAPHLRCNFTASTPPNTYHQTGSFSSLANPRCHVPPPPPPPQTTGQIPLLTTDQLGECLVSGQSETSMEMTRGPRGRYNNFLLKPSLVKDALVITICKDEYNLSDFQTEYETAKFNVIKSFNEDEVHKSVKYNVWTSTPNGNKKLNAAFLDAEAKLRPTGTKCPVNASRQFVGVAEILGPFVHIILPSNENKPVTYTRDTQERREKLFRSQRSTKHARPEQGVYGNDNYQNTVEAREKKIEMQSSGTKQGTLVKLTKNLTLNSSGFR